MLVVYALSLGVTMFKYAGHTLQQPFKVEEVMTLIHWILLALSTLDVIKSFASELPGFPTRKPNSG